MSQGYLIYAYNNSNIDYGTIALCNSLLIKKNCKVNNVALVTSSWTIKYLEKLYGTIVQLIPINNFNYGIYCT